MSKELVFAVKARSVGPQKPFHASDQIGERRFRNEMKMVSHEAPGVDLPVGFGAALPQGPQEESPICVVAKNGFATISAIHEVIDGSGIFDSELARHQQVLSNRSTLCQIRQLDC